MKRFKPRKKNNFVLIIIVVIFVYLLIKSMYVIFKDIKPSRLFLNDLLYNVTHSEKRKQDIIEDSFKYILKVDLNKPLTLIQNVFKYDEEEKISVYIYNSHQKEEYVDGNIIEATKLLSEKLNELNISNISLTDSMNDFMILNNYGHDKSYIASRYFITNDILENDFDLIIDLHRDSITKENSIVKINGKKYAKTLFVVGLENTNYVKNLELTKKINNLFDQNYKGLSRGIYKKSGEGVDGVYNQDLNPNMILLELGGYQNNMEEIKNTIDIIAKTIKEYLDERK